MHIYRFFSPLYLSLLFPKLSVNISVLFIVIRVYKILKCTIRINGKKYNRY